MKKFPGKFFSLRLLYVRSSTSRTGNAPKPRGSTSNRFILSEIKRSDKSLSRNLQLKFARPTNYTDPTFKILNFGICDRDIGSSVMQLLKRFNISRLTRLARPGGTATSKAIIDPINQLNYQTYIACITSSYITLNFIMT